MYADYVPGTRDRAQDEGSTERSAPVWRGAGGRWLVWAFRVIAWAVLLVIGYRGVTAIIFGETIPATAPPAARPSAPARFPAQLADAYALEFGRVYLNASPATATERATELASFLPPGADPQWGWNGSGSLVLQSEEVAGEHVVNAHQAVVTLLARVSGNLMELGVPVYAARGALVISGEPAWLPAPSRAPLAAAPTASSDAATQAALASQLPAFFQAYASGNQATLSRFLAPGTVISGLGGAVDFGSLASVSVPPGGNVRHVVVTVGWRIPQPAPARGGRAAAPAGLDMTYALTVVKLSGSWYVTSIGSATSVPGLP